MKKIQIIHARDLSEEFMLARVNWVVHARELGGVRRQEQVYF